MTHIGETYTMQNELKIGNRVIGKNYPPLVIPEIGINHEGSFKKAKKMISDAYKSGAECVKFQCHIVDDEMIKNNVIPANAKQSIWNIMKRCSLTEEEEIKLKNYTEKLGMIYLSTPFSRKAANRLQSMNVCAYKIGSGECNNLPLVKHIASFGKPIILSTGMNNIRSIRASVSILKKAKVDFALLHTTSMYPTPYDKVRLGALDDLKSNFPNSIIGLSDHSLGNYTCFAAIPYGALILEKHFTSNKKWKGPDISLSIDPKELKELIQGSFAIKQALDGKKTILIEEDPTIKFAYASVVTTRNIKKNELLTTKNIWVKRPGTGSIPARKFDTILKKHAKKNIAKDKQLSYSDIS